MIRRNNNSTVIPPNDLVHYKPFRDNSNVRCLNGSAHRRYSEDLKEVTCPKCKDPKTAEGFWHVHETEHGNENKNF